MLRTMEEEQRRAFERAPALLRGKEGEGSRRAPLGSFTVVAHLPCPQ